MFLVSEINSHLPKNSSIMVKIQFSRYPYTWKLRMIHPRVTSSIHVEFSTKVCRMVQTFHNDQNTQKLQSHWMLPQGWNWAQEKRLQGMLNKTMYYYIDLLVLSCRIVHRIWISSMNQSRMHMDALKYMNSYLPILELIEIKLEMFHISYKCRFGIDLLFLSEMISVWILINLDSFCTT